MRQTRYEGDVETDSLNRKDLHLSEALHALLERQIQRLRAEESLARQGNVGATSLG